MVTEQLQRAWSKLPKEVLEMAQCLEEDGGPKLAGAYLRQQLSLVDKTLRFKVEPLGKQLPSIRGVRRSVQIDGIKFSCICTSQGETWIVRRWLCNEMGWSNHKLSSISPNGEKAQLLNSAGYSFDFCYGSYEGSARTHLVCISLEDARIAISVFGGLSNAA